MSLRQDCRRTPQGGSYTFRTSAVTRPSTPIRQRAHATPMSDRLQSTSFGSPASKNYAKSPNNVEIELCGRIQAQAEELQYQERQIVSLEDEVEAKQSKIEGYEAKLKRMQEQVQTLQKREAPYIAFFNDPATVLQQLGFQEAHDMTKVLHRDTGIGAYSPAAGSTAIRRSWHSSGRDRTDKGRKRRRCPVCHQGGDPG